jgi:elongation factor 2 kinase
MDAKRLCEAYNRSVPPPPKQIDMLSAAVLQIQRPALPPGLGSISETGTCLVEPLVPGEYVKHSSNLGYVDESKRLTPRCFSHFTFEATGGEAMVVDIQGVGDVLTDPQIHTADGRGP